MVVEDVESVLAGVNQFSIQCIVRIFIKSGTYQFQYPPLCTDDVKYRTAKRTHVPMALGRAKFHVNRCNESPLWGENADFGLTVNEIPTGYP